MRCNYCGNDKLLFIERLVKISDELNREGSVTCINCKNLVWGKIKNEHERRNEN